MAMDGDRGIAEAMGLELDLGDTIAKGCAAANCILKSKHTVAHSQTSAAEAA